MERNHNRFVEILAVGIAVAMIGYMAAKAFADQIGVDVTAGGRLLFSGMLCIALIGYAVWCELTDGVFGFRALMPLALSTLWSGMWPAMQYWGVKTLYFPGLPVEQQDVEWWATSYTHWGGMAVLLIGGYALAYWTWTRRYY
ncbi:hypothetical protein [Pseudomonas rhodesiae]|jgi:hypothetical protein|uniref:hypothetical protein n=1 Tax=Pseudomonas rhodesiae TaxID=76760 RepID=UPI0020A1F43A|nr:hypothetical protein [Pseudomonas rhodesiae]MCP1515589.1 hypothetical protein [Pseudomonas rhodesiae]MDF9772992.1 hypothetical protein [Pseudomonas rhodesiae]